ncbi:protein of unknown function [Tenacibaculum sp. MAR_2009_124]|uniref:DUF4476 domain-containing protein n=1 Tax=Tenacibaculum sp. MAR_2009_124 TaxID=1250059 RepID=UPI000898B71D|nr:DUF4476 domain-containing protein [Tenacibaculum sp. MAR_2009_124]SEB39731.1 protein of unknown function [Tenacibaculum sp. MAR_2009_124]
MKLKTILLTFCLASSVTFAQHKTDDYKSFKNELRKKELVKNNNYDKSIDYISHHNLLVIDLIDMCSYFRSDRMKYKVCLKAFPTIIDKKNFFKVYDSFNSFSYAIKLYHETEGMNKQNESEIHFPDPFTYNGVISSSCERPISQYAFEEILHKIEELKNENYRLSQLKKSIYHSCLSTEEIMKLTQTLDSDQNRAIFLSYAVDYAYDIENYFYVKQLIDNKFEKQQLVSFINKKVERIVSLHTAEHCKTSPSELDYILKTIKDQQFSKEKINIAKAHIAKNCFDLPQLSLIVNQFSFDTNKLDILKYSFQYSEEKNKFYTLRDLLNFSNNKRDFDEFLLSNRI